MHASRTLATAFALFIFFIIFIEPIYADGSMGLKGGQTIFDPIDREIGGEEDILEIHAVIDNKTLSITARTRNPPDLGGDVNYYFNLDTDMDMKRDYQITIEGPTLRLCSNISCYNLHGKTLSSGDVLKLSIPLELIGNSKDIGISAFTYSNGSLKNLPTAYREVGWETPSLFFNIDGDPEDWTDFSPISIGKSRTREKEGVFEAYATRYNGTLYVMIDPIADLNLSMLNYVIYIDYNQDAKEDYSVFFDKYKSGACIKDCTYYYGWESAFQDVVEFKTELPGIGQRDDKSSEPEKIGISKIGISLGIFDKDNRPISITPFKMVEPLNISLKMDSFDAEELNKVNAIYNISISKKDPGLAHVTLKLDNVYGGITRVSIDFKNMYFWQRFINFSSSSNLEETKTGFISNITGNEYTLDYYVRLNIPIEYKKDMRSYSTKNWAVTDTTSLFPSLSFAKYPHANFRFILYFDIPPTWKVVSEMEKIGEREYRSYYSGIVKPEGIIGMGDFEIFEKEGYGKRFVLARYGKSPADPEDVLEMFIKLTPTLSEMTDSDVGEKIVIINAPKPMYVGFAKSDSIFVNVEDPVLGDGSRSVYAHEYVHLFQKWYGTYGIDKKNGNAEWIKEGIAEYYSSKALLDAGYITEDEHTEFLKDYYYKSEKFRSESLSNTTRENDMPIYVKGTVIIWKLDNLIYEITGGKKDFSDVLKKTNRDFNKKKLNNQEFEQIIEEVSGTDFQEFFQKYVYGGELPPAELILSRSHGTGGRIRSFDILPVQDVESLVVLSNGEPISRSSVRIKDKTLITDSRGRIHIEDIDTGPAVLEVEKPGFFTSQFYVLLVPRETLPLVFFLSLIGISCISYFIKKH